MADFKPQWPSLEEQLRDAKVIPGSALEQLIMENQDFSMLDPEEVNDKHRLPPWLRVYWRKSHPDANYTPPSGGYPLLLKEALEWMMDHQDLPVAKPSGRVPLQQKETGGEHGQ